MPVPAEYLRYPHRTRGMDHDRYEWSILFRQKAVEWPGRARIALLVMPALEWFPLDMTGKPFRAPGGLERPYPDYRYYTSRDYGNRVGVFRIMEVLDELGVRASVPMNSALAERLPVLVGEVTRRGWELVAHGVHMDRLHHGGLPVEEERRLVQEAVGTLRHRSGQPVTGWLSPARSESHHTLDLLAAEGIQYVCDWVNDDMPYPMQTAHGPIYAMPHSQEINDRVLLLEFHHTETEFVEQVTDQFDALYREAGRHGGRIMAITLHPWVIGQPYRIGALRAALSHILRHAGVWSATAAEILAAWRAQL